MVGRDSDFDDESLTAQHTQWLAVLNFFEALVKSEAWCKGWMSRRYRHELHLKGPGFAQITIQPDWYKVNFLNDAAAMHYKIDPNHEWSEPKPSFRGFESSETARNHLVDSLRDSIRNALDESEFCAAAMQSRDTPQQEKH